MPIEMLVGVNVIHSEGYQSYREEMTPILESIGGGFRYDFNIAEVLKSESEAPMNRVFAIHFPSRGTMDSFFSNDNYLAIKKRYFEPSVTHMTIIATYER